MPTKFNFKATISGQTSRYRDLRNTLIYINLEKALFQKADEDYHIKVATTLDEACKLLEVGFEYLTEMNGSKLFRKESVSYTLY